MSIRPVYARFRQSLGQGMAFARDRKGSVAIFSAIVLSMTLGFVGLGAEVGYWFLTKKKLQNVADASAYAAAVEIRADKSSSVATTAANAILTRIGGVPATTTLAVTTNDPFTSGPYNGRSGAAVVATATVPAMFSALFRANDTVTIRSRAVAVLSLGASTCILGLQKTGTAVNFTGNGVTRLVGCDVHSNSVASDGLQVWGNSVVTTGCIASSGGLINNGGLSLTECTKAVTLAPQIADPYASLPAPTVPSSCATIPSSGGAKGKGGGSTTTTLDAGRYCGGLDLNGGTWELRPGVYVIDGGEFRINASTTVNAVSQGSTPAGVTIYLINGATLAFNGTATINLNAQVSGTYAGVLFFGDRTGAAANHLINGTADSNFRGIIYTPNDNVDFKGNGDMANDPCTLLIANTITVSGNAKFGSNCTGSGLVMPKTIQVIAIVE
jgi:Flp pilus assembly protein TadG